MESIAFLFQKIRSKREINSSCKNECNSYLIDYKEFRMEKHAKKNIIWWGKVRYMERQQEYELRKKIADAIQNDVDRVFSEKLYMYGRPLLRRRKQV